MTTNKITSVIKKNTKPVFVVFLFLFSMSLWSQNNNYDVIMNANIFFDKENYSEAIPLYKKAILQDSLNSKIYYQLGVCLHHSEIEHFTIEKRNEKNKEGFYYLQKAIQLDSTKAEYYRYAATTLLCSDQANMGNKYALKAIILDGRDFDNWEILFRISNFDGSTYPQKNEKARRAVANYRQLLLKNANDKYLYYGLAMSYERCSETCDSTESIKNYDSTIYYFKEYSKLIPDLEYTYFKLDQMYFFHPKHRQMLDEKIKNLNNWLNYATDKSEVYSGLFFIYLDSKNYSEANTYYVILNKDFPDSFNTKQVNDAVKYSRKEFKWSKRN